MGEILLDKSAAFVIDLLENGGYEAYAAGGCVRDSLLGKTPNDWDIATAATPQQAQKLFRKMRLAVIPTGIEHGTITVVVNGQNLEVTSYRVDGGYSDGRRPDSVTFSTDIKFDLSRRDFTVNAMAYSETRGLVDLFHGREDLANRVIRAVGNPKERFAEDYLRILRAFRFAATLDFEIETETRAAAIEMKQSVSSVSKERIRAEFEKAIVNGSPRGVTDFLVNLIGLIAPEVKDAEEAAKRVNSCERNAYARLSALLYFCEKPDRILKNLKYDNKTIEAVSLVLSAKDFKTETKADIKRILNKIGAENFAYFNDVTKANAQDLHNEVTQNNEPYLIKHLNITGADIMSGLNVPAGKAVGNALNSLLEKVIEQPELNEKEKLLHIIKGE
ncbi:polynucleotide adenylyltransferase [Clostridia bacterium]|nr:polynucleotide adenylyltransferase [Clostridia bacterium]